MAWNSRILPVITRCLLLPNRFSPFLPESHDTEGPSPKGRTPTAGQVDGSGRKRRTISAGITVLSAGTGIGLAGGLGQRGGRLCDGLSVPYSSGSGLLDLVSRQRPSPLPRLSVPYSSGSGLLGSPPTSTPGALRTFSPLFIGVGLAGLRFKQFVQFTYSFSPLFIGVGLAGLSVRSIFVPPLSLSVPYSSGSGLLACSRGWRRTGTGPFQSPIHRGRACWPRDRGGRAHGT